MKHPLSTTIIQKTSYDRGSNNRGGFKSLSNAQYSQHSETLQDNTIHLSTKTRSAYIQAMPRHCCGTCMNIIILGCIPPL